MAFCSKCGAELPVNGKFCEKCGASVLATGVSGNSAGVGYAPPVKTPTQKLAQREQIAAIVWMIVAVLQALIGLTNLAISGGLMWFGDLVNGIFESELLGFGLNWDALFTLGLATLNAYGSYCSFKREKKVLARVPGIVAEYDRTLTMSIVAIVANVLLGAIIGIAGGVFDLFNRYYALSNANYLEN